MISLNDIIKILFQKITPNQILTNQITYDNFPAPDFHALVFQEMKHLSETDAEQIRLYLIEKSGKLDVFEIIGILADRLLIIRENQPMCRYEKLFYWRELVRNVGEDLPICAFLANRRKRTGDSWTDFEWMPVIPHNNMQLKRIMQRGLADNHFHLFGSAPIFQLCWLKMMNDVRNPKIIEGLCQIDRKRRVMRPAYSPDYREETLETMCFQAAVIRAALYQYLQNRRYDAEIFNEKIFFDSSKLMRILTEPAYQRAYVSEVQTQIDAMRDISACYNKNNRIDYALAGYGGSSLNHDFEGERALIYHMMCGEIDEVPIPHMFMNLFYAYLVIKGKFYEELCQVNENIGFENFRQYSGRKNFFLYTRNDIRRMIRHAVLESISLQNMQSLEIRISPCDTVNENRKMIQEYDRNIREFSENTEKNILQRIYYVIHFAKERDDNILPDVQYLSTCRHHKFRQKLSRKTESLIQLREEYPCEASRILGIDACAQELNCRPEVFGPTFRRLSQHVVNNSYLYQVGQWKKTYHVGEDWRDLADGLRAIDEAIMFLNMGNGDRLGHATALGIDVKKWYQGKNQGMVLPLQEYLDNVVWLYHKLQEYDIPSETLKMYLHNEYEKCFSRLYMNYIDQGVNAAISAEMQKDYDTPINPAYLRFDINTYYEAWKLRGDDPALYLKGYYQKRYDLLQEYAVNRELEDGVSIRSRVETGLLMYYYHYSSDIRREGEKPFKTNFPDYYIEGVCQIQRGLQKRVSDLGIGIETNPTSNYLISPINEYREHPISNFFNLGLTLDETEIRKCPQLHVSINTDDKGVFNTSLENEFGLMACATEYWKDEKGCYKYSRQLVYDWLDRIREYGLQQSFLNTSEKKV